MDQHFTLPAHRHTTLLYDGPALHPTSTQTHNTVVGWTSTSPYQHTDTQHCCRMDQHFTLPARRHTDTQHCCMMDQHFTLPAHRHHCCMMSQHFTLPAHRHTTLL